MELTDLVLNRYRYFLRKPIIDDEEIERKLDETKLRELFTDRLIESLTEMGAWNESDQKKNESDRKELLKPEWNQGYFVPIEITPIISKDTPPSEIIFTKLISGIFLDVYSIQEWVAISGKIPLDTSKDSTFEELKTKAKTLNEYPKTYSKIKSELKTECNCFFTEFGEDPNFEKRGRSKKEAHNLSEALINKTVFTLLKTNNPSLEENPSVIDLGHSYFSAVFTKDKSDAVIDAVIISKNYADSEAKDKASKIFDEIMREYFLSFSKVINEFEGIEKSKIREIREALLSELEDFERIPPKTLSQIEKANLNINKHRANLAKANKQIEAHLHTIELNMGNAERILENDLLKNQKDELYKLLLKPLQYKIDQEKVNLAYYNNSKERAAIIGEEIATAANLQSAIWERKLACLFGVLSIIGALQLFPEFQTFSLADEKTGPTFWWRVGIIAIFIITTILILFGSHIKTRLFSK